MQGVIIIKSNITDLHQFTNQSIKFCPTVAVAGGRDWPCQREQKDALQEHIQTNDVSQPLAVLHEFRRKMGLQTEGFQLLEYWSFGKFAWSNTNS